MAGKRQDEVVTEDKSIDWDRSDYDPYARTKKFCEHMIRQLLPEVPITIFRPSIVLGDSRHAETTQFDMVKAFVFLAGLPVLPFRAKDKIDIVNVDFVADAIATLHQKENPQHDTYHLSSGADSQTFRQLTSALAAAQNKRGPVFLPFLERPFHSAVNLSIEPPTDLLGRGASLMKVFMPYLVWNTVFDNTRVTRNSAASRCRFRSTAIRCSSSAARPTSPIATRTGPARRPEGPPHDGLVLEAWVSSSIEVAKLGWMLGKGKPWQPGEKLKLLFAGYNGTRNMGSDVRVSKKCCARSATFWARKTSTSA